MNTTEVAEKLAQYCREGKNVEAIEELYSDDVISKEAYAEMATGKEAVIAKNKHWMESVQEVHSSSIGDPIVTGNIFACTMDMDVTFKERGRVMMNEIALYEVKNGKIVSDQFFYTM